MTDSSPSNSAGPIVLRGSDRTGLRISPGDTNYMVPLTDPILHGDSGVGFTAAIEIFNVGGATPPNTHHAAAEFFYVLRGSATARAGDHTVALAAGDALVVPPGFEHVIENVGTTKLYTLTVMVPDENFAELIHGGEPVDPTADLYALEQPNGS